MNTLGNYPFVKELVFDSLEKLDKVIINLSDYQKLIELLEDEAMYRAILEVRDEQSLSLVEAIQEL